MTSMFGSWPLGQLLLFFSIYMFSPFLNTFNSIKYQPTPSFTLQSPPPLTLRLVNFTFLCYFFLFSWSFVLFICWIVWRVLNIMHWNSCCWLCFHNCILNSAFDWFMSWIHVQVTFVNFKKTDWINYMC